MGPALGIPLVEIIGDALAGILGADVASGAAIIAGEAIEAGESASLVIGDTIGLTTEESGEVEQAVKSFLEKGGSKSGIGEIAAAAYQEVISGNIASTIEELTTEAAQEISAAAEAGEEIGVLPEQIEALVDEGVISESAAIELEQIPEVTDSDLGNLGVTRREFEVFEIESGDAYEGLSEESKGFFQKLKGLGKKIIDLIKKAMLACIKSKIRIALCVAELAELIFQFHSKFFKKGKDIINFVGADAYKIGVQVANIISTGIGKYYDKIVADPSIGQQEVVIENLILEAFKEVSIEVNDTIARTIYNVIRTSKFLVSPEIKKKFESVFKVYNGNFQREPFRDPKTGFITYTDEVGDTFSYKDKPNPTSRTTLYGTWVGPNSFNDTLPLSDTGIPEPGKKVRRSGSGLLDKYAYAHDISYSKKSVKGGGFFNQTGDFQLISRTLQNMSRMTAQEQVVAHATVGWFSSVGMILNTLIHPLIVVFEDVDPLTNTYVGSLFSKLFKPTKKKTVQGQIVLQGNQKKEDLTDDRKKFYRGIKDTLEQQQVDFSISNGAGGSVNNYSSLLQAFDNILVSSQC